jgi:predicted ATP-dependent protease
VFLDYERCWLDFRARLLEKRGWGQDELIRAMAEVERDSRLEDTGHDPNPRRTAAPRETATGAPEGRSGMSDLAHPLSAEEVDHGSTDAGRARARDRAPAAA